MPDNQLGARQDVNEQVENAGPVLFSLLSASPVEIEGFDPVGKPVSQLIDFLVETKGINIEGMQVSITNGGEGGRVGMDAIVRPGDYVQLAENIENN